MADNTGAAVIQGLDRVAARLVGSLNKLFGFQYTRNAEHYVYHLTVVSGTADAVGATFSSAVRVTQEADFVCTRLNASTRVSTAGTGTVGCPIGLSNTQNVAGDWPDVPYTILITDGGTDRQLSNEAVDFMSTYGTQGGLPGVWARPRLFARNSIISVRLTSLKTIPASTVWTTRLAFIGWKIYDATALDLTSKR